MTMHHQRDRSLRAIRSVSAAGSRGGFTLVELLVAMGIIALLVSMVFGVLGTAGERSRSNATKTTIAKIQGIISTRSAEIKALDYTNAGARRPANRGLQRVLAEFDKPAAHEAYWRKWDYVGMFPCRFEDLAGLDGQPGVPGVNDAGSSPGVDTDPNTRIDLLELGLGINDDGALAKKIGQMLRDEPSKFTLANHKLETESAELLYLAITLGETYGTQSVTAGDLSAREVRDTDKDGLLEFVDGWERPLRFYRWPTRLTTPDDDADPNNGFPAIPIGKPLEIMMTNRIGTKSLAQDPDDPAGNLSLMASRLKPSQVTALKLTRTQLHDPDVFHTPLIVSCGADGELGMFETADAANFGFLAQPFYEDWPDSTLSQSTFPNPSTEPSRQYLTNPGSTTLNDNISNLQGRNN